MEKIYSQVSPETLLHIVVSYDDFREGRQDLIEPDQWLQCSMIQMNEGKTFKPHHHNWNKREEEYIAQESWVVVNGSVKCIFYDLNNEIIAERILYNGDASFSLAGGHNYVALENKTKVYEMKSGKYLGQEKDKTFID